MTLWGGRLTMYTAHKNANQYIRKLRFHISFPYPYRGKVMPFSNVCTPVYTNKGACTALGTLFTILRTKISTISLYLHSQTRNENFENLRKDTKPAQPTPKIRHFFNIIPQAPSPKMAYTKDVQQSHKSYIRLRRSCPLNYYHHFLSMAVDERKWHRTIPFTP